MTTQAKTTPTDDEVAARTLIITRIINAPRPLVFAAWTDPAQVGQWWGPDGFTTTIQEMEVRPGGRWRYIMHGPDGTDYDNRVTYEEVVAPEKLVYLHGSDRDNDPDAFFVVVTFQAKGSQTEITMNSRFPSIEALKEAQAYGAEEGGNQTLGRLEGYLASEVNANG